ncbi:MAG: S9 family peptidase [Planctomycetota bacterium]|jgi:oligopeptidase B
MAHHPFLLVASLALVVSALPRTQEVLRPPVAKRVPHVQVWHGTRFEDPYFWLREKDNPEVRAHLEAENAYTRAMTAGQKPFEEALYQEFVGRVQQSDLSVPTRVRSYCYYSRTVEGLQYPISCRKPAKADGTVDEAAAEQVLLDANELGRGLPYFDIGSSEVSDDDQRLAYSTDVSGFRQYVLHVKDLATGAVQKDLAERVTSFEWAADGKTLFFTTEDPVTKRSDTLWRLVPGEAPVKLYAEKDELFRIGIGRTRDRKWLMLGIGSTDTAEWRVLPADSPGGEWRSVLPRQQGHRYLVDHRDGSWYVTSDQGAVNFRVVQVPVGKPELAGGKEIVPHRGDVQVESFDVYATHAVVTEKAAALTRFRVLDFATGTWRELSFPEPVYAAFAGGTPEFTSTTFRIGYQSMVTPSSVYDVVLATGERLLRKQTVVKGYDAAKYRSERLWAKARDGVQVPISIVFKDGHPRDGSRPLWLYAYGSYGFGMPATFDSDRISLLDRGVAFAIAHIRGGDEMGQQWHKDGMLMKKKNTFFDFVDVAEHLIATKWTAAGKLMIEGGSAGGLLMGAVANIRPDLFAAVHSAVPFVDVMNTMMDASLPLTVGEYLEWGNPNEKAAFDYMRSYSPYDNLEPRRYPATLVTTSFNDSQVMYWEPAKYVAKLRTVHQGDAEVLFRCKLEAAGHGGASGRYDRWRDTAFEMAWMLRQVGITR